MRILYHNAVTVRSGMFAEDFTRLRATCCRCAQKDGGVLRRRGHTEPLSTLPGCRTVAGQGYL